MVREQSKFATMLNEDIKVRSFLRSKLAHAAVSKIVIERPAKGKRLHHHSQCPSGCCDW